MPCPLLIKWHVLYWSNVMSSIDQMTCPLLIKWDVLYWSNDMSSIDQMTLYRPYFYSLGNINHKKPHKVCMWLSNICKYKCSNAKVPPLKIFNENISIYSCWVQTVIYQNLPILLYITVIKLISNIISNFYTYICLSCIFNS